MGACTTSSSSCLCCGTELCPCISPPLQTMEIRNSSRLAHGKCHLARRAGCCSARGTHCKTLLDAQNQPICACRCLRCPGGRVLHCSCPDPVCRFRRRRSNVLPPPNSWLVPPFWSTWPVCHADSRCRHRCCCFYSKWRKMWWSYEPVLNQEVCMVQSLCPSARRQRALCLASASSSRVQRTEPGGLRSRSRGLAQHPNAPHHLVRCMCVFRRHLLQIQRWCLVGS
jgi:hypothetical protein